MCSSNGRRLGVLTIGQSPRDDVVPAMAPFLPDVTFEEAGALDGLSDEEITALAPREGEQVLVTRLRSGREVQVAKERLLRPLQGRLNRFQKQGIHLVLLMCTGAFPPFDFAGLLLQPARILHATARAVAGEALVGVLVPAREQVSQLAAAWDRSGLSVTVEHASPYARPDELNPAVDRLVAGGAELIVMDCMGYKPEQKRMVQERSGLPVLLANTTIARVTAELLS